MQQNEDFHYWSVDFHSIYHRGVDTHGMEIVRCPVGGSRLVSPSNHESDHRCILRNCSRHLPLFPWVALWERCSTTFQTFGHNLQAVDFDPHSLRKVLPSAVRVVAAALAAGKK